jgi:hypothetical protein
LDPAQKVELEHTDNDNGQNVVIDSGTMTLENLVAGQIFYMFAGIQATADGPDQFADAFSTVELTFVAGCEDVALVVPLPPAAWLLGSALLALGAMHRRRKAA